MCYLRLVHAVPGAPNVDVYVNKVKLVTNLSFSEVGGYLHIQGSKLKVQVKVVVTGTSDLVVKAYVSLRSEYTSVVVCLDGEHVVLQSYQDDHVVDKAGTTLLRLIHLVQGAPAVNLLINDKVFLKNVEHLHADERKLALGKFFYTASVVLNIPGGGTIVGPKVITPMNRTAHTIFVMGTVEDVKGVFVLDNNAINDVLDKNFDLQSYMGEWNLIAEIPQPYVPPGCVKQEAVYTLLHDQVKVYNKCYNAQFELMDSIVGKAVVPNPLYPAALRVDFDVVPPIGTPGNEPNYLVHKYVKGEYAYVGSGNRVSYYLLSRVEKIQQRVYDYFVYMGAELGYNTSKIVRYDNLK